MKYTFFSQESSLCDSTTQLLKKLRAFSAGFLRPKKVIYGMLVKLCCLQTFITISSVRGAFSRLTNLQALEPKNLCEESLKTFLKKESLKRCESIITMRKKLSVNETCIVE